MFRFFWTFPRFLLSDKTHRQHWHPPRHRGTGGAHSCWEARGLTTPTLDANSYMVLKKSEAQDVSVFRMLSSNVDRVRIYLGQIGICFS